MDLDFLTAVQAGTSMIYYLKETVSGLPDPLNKSEFNSLSVAHLFDIIKS